MKQLVLIGLCLLLCGASVRPAEAHLLATDNTIGAVLHIDPNDQPVAGSQASFFFEFKDKTNLFDPSNCDCSFIVSENGRQIYSQPLFQSPPTPTQKDASVFYTLPKKDIYQIEVVGKPIKADTFQPFTLQWNIRVDQEASNHPVTNTFWTTHWLHLLMGSIGVAVFLWLFLSQKKRPSKKTARGGEK